MRGAASAVTGRGVPVEARGQVRGERIVAVDVARTAAILGMVLFHFVYDLEMFGLLPPGTTDTGPWAWFARGVAGSFLFLVGVSLWLAHGQGIRWRAFWRRFAKIAAAAALVSAATWAAMPASFVYFGILHSIALASLIGLAFLRSPAAVSALAALAVWAVTALWGGQLFATPWLGWTGLSAEFRPAIDLVPLFPWLAPCLLGIAFAKWAGARGWLRAKPAPAWLQWVGWPGRHALAIYLLHQPVMIALLWLALRLAT